MTWVLGNLDLIGELLLQHLAFAIPPILLGLVLAIPLGWFANRNTVLRSTLLNVSGLLYTVPSLALFVLLPPLLGTGILNPANVIVALTIYTVALLVRTVADGLAAVPSAVVNSATAMGYTPLRRFISVELPMAVPVILAGLRVAAVSAISLVTVGAVIGFGGLGKMFTDAFQRDIPAETIAGIVLVLLLALAVDGVIVLIGRALTPWTRVGLGRREARVSYFGWLFDPANWTGSGGVPARLVEHLGYVALAMIIALVIALPIGAWVGHTGRGGFLVVGSANALRALPTLGVLILLVAPFGLSIIGPLIALVVLAVPPLLAGTYAGVRNVDPAVVDAARGMGMRGREVLWRVELPNALPLIIGGVRSAVLQVDLHGHDRGLRRPRRAGPVHLRRPRPARFPADDRRIDPGRAARHRRRPAAWRRSRRSSSRPACRPSRAAARAGCAQCPPPVPPPPVRPEPVTPSWRNRP